jgi:hypothetical protein
VTATPDPVALSEEEHLRLVAVVSTAAQNGPQSLLRLWDDLVAVHGVDATSRLWQEALSSGDVGQT